MTRTITRLLILASVAVALTPLAGLFVQSTYASGVSEADMDDCKIVVPADAIPSEKYAAEELQAFFEQATGIRLSIALLHNFDRSRVFVLSWFA